MTLQGTSDGAPITPELMKGLMTKAIQYTQILEILGSGRRDKRVVDAALKRTGLDVSILSNKEALEDALAQLTPYFEERAPEVLPLETSVEFDEEKNLWEELSEPVKKGFYEKPGSAKRFFRLRNTRKHLD